MNNNNFQMAHDEPALGDDEDSQRQFQQAVQLEIRRLVDSSNKKLDFSSKLLDKQADQSLICERALGSSDFTNDNNLGRSGKDHCKVQQFNSETPNLNPEDKRMEAMADKSDFDAQDYRVLPRRRTRGARSKNYGEDYVFDYSGDRKEYKIQKQ